MSQANDRQVGGDHYHKHGTKLQHWDLVAIFQWDYFQGQIIKYLMRWREKNGVQDLEKAAHYLQKYIVTEQHLPDIHPLIVVPMEIVEAALLVGKFFRQHNIEDWKLGPCQARREFAPDQPSELALEVLTEYAQPGEVQPTGWIGYTFEGADAGGFHFRCKKCLVRFWVQPEGNPHRVHDEQCVGMMRGEEPGPAYVGQAADPALP